MQNENYDTYEYQRASSDYFTVLNKVNLLLLKEHTFNLEKTQYEEEIAEVEKLISTLETPSTRVPYCMEAEWEHLQKIIRANKREIWQLKFKLQPKDNLLSECKELHGIQQKYFKIVSAEYQNVIQQKLSMIRGKVDDLKKKIKQINKDILSYEQEHTELIDDHSFELKRLAVYQVNNAQLREEIAKLKKKPK